MGGTLARLGIRGARRCAQGCVVAVFLQRRFQTNVVGVWDTDESGRGGFAQVEQATVQLPPSVDQFLMDFDAGVWPELEVA